MHSVQHISGGSYHYFRIKEGVEDLIKLYDQDIPKPIPLFKSTRALFWLILGTVSKPFLSNPLVIALNFDEHKPKSFSCKTDCELMYSDCASTLLKNFVEDCSKLCGREMIVYYVHSLIHSADDAKKFGALERISSFPFEN